MNSEEENKQLQHVNILGIIKLRLRPKALQGIVNSLVIVIVAGGLGLMSLSGSPVGQQLAETKSGVPGSAFMERGDKRIYFAKTFVFWVPKFKNPDAKTEFKAERYDQLHRWITESFGGWTRWPISGGKINSTPGYLYQTSLRADKPTLDAGTVSHRVRNFFNKSDIYIIENIHRGNE